MGEWLREQEARLRAVRHGPVNCALTAVHGHEGGMLGNLQLDGFRGFETYSLNELTRVTLLVGKNNCGKTSILEATQFLVFATTHSLDCIRGLAALVESYPDVAGEVSTHKIERLLDKAVRFDATDVHAAVEHNIEMR